MGRLQSAWGRRTAAQKTETTCALLPHGIQEEERARIAVRRISGTPPVEAPF